MNNDNRTVLKLFTRKLANCRYRVQANSLVEYFKSGKFGFTRPDDSDTVVTNEYLFVDDVATAITHLKAIFKEPHISLKQEEAILNASNASSFDQRSLNQSVKDEKLWKLDGGVPHPEYVHGYVQEDDLAIYENRFLSALIDVLFNAVTAKLSEVVVKLKTFNGEIAGYDLNLDSNAFNRSDYVKFVQDNGGLPVLTTNKDGTVTIINALARARKNLLALKDTQIYVACKKAKGFDIETVQPTNIIMHDVHYNFCYKFFTKYFKKDINFCSDKEMYVNFVTVSSFLALDNLGFTADEENESISINNATNLKFSPLTFSKAPFIVKLTQGEDELIVKVINEVDRSTAKYSFKIVYSKDAKKPFIPEDYAYKLMKDKQPDVIGAYLITDVGRDGSENVTKIVANQCDAEKALDNLFKSILMLAEGSEYVHSRYCPICGGSMVSSEGEDYYCDTCNGLYHLFDYKNKTLIWIKRLPTPAKDNGLKLRSINSKSFKDKIAQSEGNEKAYYLELKNYILEYKKTRSKLSFSCDTITAGRNKLVKFAMRGKTLVMFTALDFATYENTKYRPKYKGDVKKYKDTPTMVKIKSDRGLKFAKELIDILCEGMKKRTPEELAKILEVAVTIDEPKTPFMTGDYVSKSFTAKVCQSDVDVKEFYTELKAYVLSYKKVRSNVSWNYDNVHLGRNSIIKFAMRGKTLVMFTSLDFKAYENTKYHPRFMGDVKKYEDTPTMVKIKSTRAVKFAKELIDEILKDVAKKDEYVPEPIDLKYRSDKQLIELGLAKKVFAK